MIANALARREKEDALEAMKALESRQQREFRQELLDAQERERTRIARELHAGI